MPWHAMDRVAVSANIRAAIAVPTDGLARTKVSIGNATPDDMRIDMGDANKYIVIVAGGWHDITWPGHKPTPHGAADGVAFFYTPLASGTLVLEWT